MSPVHEMVILRPTYPVPNQQVLNQTHCKPTETCALAGDNSGAADRELP